MVNKQQSIYSLANPILTITAKGKELTGFKRQRGAIVLTMSIIFLLLTTLVTLYSTRTILLEQKIVNNQTRAKLSFEAAEYGLSTAFQYLANNPDRNNDGILDSNIFNLDAANNDIGTTNSTAVGSQSVEVTLTDIDGDADVILAIRIVSQGYSDDKSASRTITQVIKVVDALPNIPDNPLTTRGSVDVNGSATVHNLEGNSTIWSGGDVDIGSNNSTATYIADPTDAAYPGCMDIPMTCGESKTSNKTSVGLDIIEHDSNLANLSAAQMFENFFGLTPDAYRAAMVNIDIVLADGDDFDTEADLAENKIIWHEGDADISGVTVGCSASVNGGNVCSAANEAPSIVIINGDATMSGGPHFYGIVFVMGDVSLSGNSTVHGALVVAGTTNNTSGSLDIWYNSGLLRGTNETGPLASSSGAWRDF